MEKGLNGVRNRGLWLCREKGMSGLGAQSDWYDYLTRDKLEAITRPETQTILLQQKHRWILVSVQQVTLNVKPRCSSFLLFVSVNSVRKHSILSHLGGSSSTESRKEESNFSYEHRTFLHVANLSPITAVETRQIHFPDRLPRLSSRPQTAAAIYIFLEVLL